MSKLLELINLIISAGPRVGEAWDHVELGVEHFQHGVDEFQLAGQVITGREVFKSAAPVALTAEEQKGVDELQAKLDELPRGIRERISNLIAIIKANPELLSILLKFFV